MNKTSNDFDIAKEEKEELIAKLTDNLIFLRTRLGMSQDEISSLLGISRQTYSTFETKRRKMSWVTYLALVMLFDNHYKTHDMIRGDGIFPSSLFEAKENVRRNNEKKTGIPELMLDEISNKLDEQAYHTIETVIMLEYARCNNMLGDVVIKAFDGKRL